MTREGQVETGTFVGIAHGSPFSDLDNSPLQERDFTPQLKFIEQHACSSRITWFRKSERQM